MGKGLTREFLTRRIDRCYLVAAWTRIAEKRDRYIARARHYRALLDFVPQVRPLPA